MARVQALLGAALLGAARACVNEGFDVGGSENACGYAREVAVVGSPGYDFTQHSWISDKGIPTREHEMADWRVCQHLCTDEYPDCQYFVFREMAQGNLHRCILKQGYDDPATCVPLYQQANEYDFAGPKVCPACFMHGYDMGGGLNSCGYASEVLVIGGEGYDFSQHSWIADKGIPTEIQEHLHATVDCQRFCVMNAKCDHFVYAPMAQGIGRCILKESYAEESCKPLYQYSTSDGGSWAAGPKMCHDGLMDGYDAGGSMNICGYGMEVKFIGGAGYDFTAHSWLADKGIATERDAHLHSAEDCRHHCEEAPLCGMFVFMPNAQGHIARCILKESYKSPMCAPVFQPYEGSVSAKMSMGGKVHCSTMKKSYKASHCCSNKDKEVAVPAWR